MANPAPNQTRRPSLKELLSSGDLISPEELAAALKIGRVTIYAWVRRGTIPCLRLESLIRFDPAEIREWLECKRQAARKAPGGGPAT
ncbi:MAG: helix-turn-helix domain-containing protein [Deltaproteobacteria bacterium]|nr:helix-turn-helix domain-containing protein [Deltaproteobacteria bacterium]